MASNYFPESGGGVARQGAVAKAETGDAVDLGPLDHWIGFHLRMAQIASFQAFARRTRELDLNPGRFAALSVIGQNPGISQTALSQAIGSDKSTLTPAVEDLVRRGIVRRTRLPQDKRTYRLVLTAAGERMLRRLFAAAAEHDLELDAIIGPRDRPQFLRGLKRIAEALS